MAYTGSYRTGYGTFNDQQVGEAFTKAVRTASPGFQGLAAGQFFTGEGGAQYKTVAGVDPNQPGWGQRVEPGWELIGYQGGAQPTGRARGMGIGQPQQGYAILRKQMEAAPTPEPTTETVVDTTPVVESTEASKENVSEAATILAGIDKLLGEIRDENIRAEKAREEAAERAAEAQRTYAANMAISQRTPNLQIMPGGQPSNLAGTQGFKVRKSAPLGASVSSILAGLNLGQSSMMNV